MNNASFFLKILPAFSAGGDFSKNPQGLSFRIHLLNISLFTN